MSTAPQEFSKINTANITTAVKDAVNTGLDWARKTVFITPTLTRSVLSIKGSNGGSAQINLAWTRAEGMNLNTIPNYGSYAQGRIKGGRETALTGELGYEVAWFPSQGTSTILGLDGPEMVDLPKDAVIFPHKQSKKIVEGNKNRPQFGSHITGEIYVGGTVTRAETSGGSSGGTIDP